MCTPLRAAELMHAVNMTARSTTTALASGITRRADGLPTRIVYGNSLTETRTYSLKGELVDQLLGGETGSYLYDPGSNLVVARIPGVSSGSLYAYDALDRLTGETSFLIGQLGYNYDANGNRLTLTEGSDTKNYSYAPASNRLTQIGRKDITLDAAGNTTSKDNGKWQFEYGQAGRLLKAYREGKWQATYLYNARGQRTQKQTKHGTTVYHYDPGGHLIAETGQGGELQKAYVWLDDMPLAQIDIKGKDKEHDKGKKAKPARETVAYLHADHLGTPRIATDASQKVVWRWDNADAFGANAPNEDPDGDGIKTTFNLRMPGQYYDKETGTHYNYFRDYDPAIGRYIQSDPIGLAGGINTYGYANQNPLIFTDPMGLMGGGAGCFPGRCGIPDPNNICTSSPDLYPESCRKHDDCYTNDPCTGKPGKSKEQCDSDFFYDMLREHPMYTVYPPIIYYLGVNYGGKKYYGAP